MTEQTPDAPDVTDTITSDDPEAVTVFVAWGRVMRDLGAITKDRRTNTGRAAMDFNFRGVDAVMNAVGPVLRKHGVMVIPETLAEVRETEYTTAVRQRDNGGQSGGTRMHNVVVITNWRVWGPQGDSFPMQSAGEAADAGDKATTKAQSVAYRIVLLQALCVPTDEPRDPDDEVHERSGGSSRPAGEAQQADAAPADKRTQHWTAIIEKGKTLTPPRDVPMIGKDFAAWRGYAINAPEVTVSDCVRYLAIMETPAAERPEYKPTPDDEAHVAAVAVAAAKEGGS